MTVGPGKYDKWAKKILVEEEAGAVLVMVFKGEGGAGISFAGEIIWAERVPEILRAVADEMDVDFEDHNAN